MTDLAGEQKIELERVYDRIAPLIEEFHRARTSSILSSNGTFHVEELRRFVLDEIPGIAPDSPGRILRAMRLEGLLDYVVLNRRASLYQFRPVVTRSQPVYVADSIGQLTLFGGV
jgi:hypothetical protein